MSLSDIKPLADMNHSTPLRHRCPAAGFEQLQAVLQDQLARLKIGHDLQPLGPVLNRLWFRRLRSPRSPRT